MTIALIYNMRETHYKTNITAGALLVPESRKIASLLLTHPGRKQWKEAIEQENILNFNLGSIALNMVFYGA